MGQIYVPTEADFPKTADVVVIGGGIVGVATAFWVSRAGLDTVLVEMRDGLSTLTTPNSVECFRAQFLEKPLVELAKPSIEIFDNFADIIGIPGYDISIHHQGYLFMTDDEGMLDALQKAVQQYHAYGVTDAEFLTGDEVRRRFPFVAPTVVGATFRQNDGWLSTHEVTQGFAKGSTAKFLISTKAIGIQVDAQGVKAVETTRGTISTRIVVNAAGPFAGVVGKMVGLDLPLTPVRRQKVFIAPQPEIPQDAPFTVDLVNEAYWRPEVGGALLGWVDPEEPPSEPAETLPVDWDFPAIVLEKVMRLSPFWEEIAERLRREEVHVSAGQYVYTPDNHPLIGPVPEVPGFYLNCGYWAGVMLSPEAGRRVAMLITGQMKPEENLLRPTRYAEGIYHPSASFLSGH
ncbi:MAG: FAD-binding oxidoreductase [Anaerolineae bacterium]|nr:FAD-binding oxidoreductase [Anaerolineae bacterium]